MSARESIQNESLNVSLIIIGDEILSGKTLDKNASWLSQFLFKEGLVLKSMRFIKDQVLDIEKALSDSLHESDIVITSGGVGPTIDDKTKSTLAHYFSKKIIERSDVVSVITQNYSRFNRTWTPETNQYHLFPEDFFAINNPLGFAPGLGFTTKEGKLLLSAPGVPKEFSEMVTLEFLPIIKKQFSNRIKENHQTIIRTQGVPEEKIFFELCPTLWSELEAFGSVSSLPHTLGIDIVVSYKGGIKTHEEKNKEIKNIITASKLLPYVWQWGNLPINQLVLDLARSKNITFGFAESCTGGLTASKITDLSGSSCAFWGSIVTYDNSVKEQILEVKTETLNKFGAVSIEVACEMAIGARLKLKTDYAISITGIAGPDGGSSDKPVGLVAIGFSSKKNSGAKIYQFIGDRLRLKDRFSDKALLTLYELLKEAQLET
ncbi:MAG: nicotinamide-nucleotide amidohydrolase family protein [Bacteriovoracaceae bacterium]|nr:nicotinamide-nucleotide amidohydrolase family protein [Bacteriovoracaceae bacterium]